VGTLVTDAPLGAKDGEVQMEQPIIAGVAHDRSEAKITVVGVPDVPGTAFVPWVVSLGGPPNADFVAQAQAAGATPGRPVVALCRSGQRSVAAAHTLTAAGLGPVYNVLAGFEGDVGPDGQRGHTGWRADGLPWRSL